LNSFDQWGVELGKQLSGPIYQALAGNSSHSAAGSAFDSSTFDSSTAELVQRFLAAQD